MAVAVVVPWRGGCPHRERNWHWVADRYRRHHPDWELVVGEYSDGPWVKALAVEVALAQTDAKTLVIADADVWIDGLTEAIEVLPGAPWVIPHRMVRRLNREATNATLAGAPFGTVTAYDERPYEGWAGGGVVVVRRADYERAPLDCRFEGFGQEDSSMALALDTLVGPHVRLNADLWHLWHPPQQRRNRQIGTQAGADLWARYREASGRPDLMAQLVAEGRAAS